MKTELTKEQIEHLIDIVTYMQTTYSYRCSFNPNIKQKARINKYIQLINKLQSMLS